VSAPEQERQHPLIDKLHVRREQHRLRAKPVRILFAMAGATLLLGGIAMLVHPAHPVGGRRRHGRGGRRAVGGAGRHPAAPGLIRPARRVAFAANVRPSRAHVNRP
jgi:hypothetical protein